MYVLYVQPYWKKILHRLFRFAVFFYALVSVALYFFQEKVLFHPGTLAPDYKFSLPLPFEERVFTAEGEKVSALLVRAPESRGLILHFHGNAGDLSDWQYNAVELAKHLHFDVYIIDYPGFGKSGGRIRNESQLHAVAAAAFLEAKKEAGAKPLVIYGRSVGSGLAVKVAAENSVAGLVLESPFFSMERLAKHYYPWAPLFLLRYALNSAFWFPQVKSPVLVMHGDGDQVIPFAEGKALASLSPKALFVGFAGGNHNDLSYQATYWPVMEKFFAGLNGATP